MGRHCWLHIREQPHCPEKIFQRFRSHKHNIIATPTFKNPLYYFRSLRETFFRPSWSKPAVLVEGFCCCRCFLVEECPFSFQFFEGHSPTGGQGVRTSRAG